MSDDPDFIFTPEDDENEDAILICMPVAMLVTPPVPSVIDACSGCDCPVWVSVDSCDVKARRLCNDCLRKTKPSDELRITPATRVRLNAMGYSDAYIEAVLYFADQQIRAGL